jgi:ribulose-phosphate 3-epimerase
MRVKIVPTILTRNFKEFKARLKTLEPHFKLVQIDCVDDRFVKNKTFYQASKIKKLKTEVDYELHLMTKEPLIEIKKWVGYKKVKRIIFHFEAVKTDQEILEIIEYLHKKGIQAGLAINLETKVVEVMKFLPRIEVLVFLGVKPGWGGQAMKLKVVEEKILQARDKFPRLNIEVDGGVNLKNIQQIVVAGANILAMGKALTTIDNLNDIKNLLKEAEKIIKKY